jgi:hypothetical protein
MASCPSGADDSTIFAALGEHYHKSPTANRLAKTLRRRLRLTTIVLSPG